MNTTNETKIWSDDWPERLDRELRVIGFRKLTELVKARPGASISQLAQGLGGTFAPIQLEARLRDEVETDLDALWYVKMMLVLQMREICPKGWRQHGRKALTHALAHWGTSLGRYRGAPHPWLRVVRRLESRNDLSDDWLPSGDDDPVIADTFQGVEFRLDLFDKSRQRSLGSLYPPSG